MNNGPIFYVMGVSGCGKSTIGKMLAKSFAIPFFDGDDYHPEANVQKMANGNPLNDNDRKGWLKSLNSLAKGNQEKGAVIACSALKEIYRLQLEQNIAPQTNFVYLKGTFDEIFERLQQRKEHFMPADLLKSQFDTLEIPEDVITVSIQLNPEDIITEIGKQYNTKKP